MNAMVNGADTNFSEAADFYNIPGFAMKSLCTRAYKFPLLNLLNRMRSGCCAFSTSSDQLNLFPEYRSALELDKQGLFSKSQPYLERVSEVVNSSMGGKSELTSQITIKIIHNLKMQGKFDQATTKLSTTDNDQTANVVHYKQLLSIIALMNGNAANAVKAATEATETCELQSSTDHDITLFSTSYSLLGLSHLCAGQVSDAEAYLQLAARWAQTPHEQIVALSNLGAVCWYLLQEEVAGAVLVRAGEERFLASNSASLTSTSSLSEEVQSHRLLREAIGYWEEALADAQKSGGVNSSSAMCGTAGSEDTLGMTGLGNKAMRVEGEKTSSVNSTPVHDVLETRLREVSYAVSYAAVLCNLAQAHHLLGDGARREEYVASALQTLQRHSEDAQAHPTLGRVLSLAAVAHLDAGQAVTAEGLFRSALDRLNGPFAAHDLRFQHEKAVTLGAYGFLLSKWDRREAAGDTMRDEARTLLQNLPVFENGIVLTPLIQFPL